VSDARQPELPADVAREVPVEAERAALEAVWHALDAARSAPAVTASESSAMWAAIVAGTSTAVAEPSTPSAVPAPVASRSAARSRHRPAWARRRVRAAALVVLAVAVAILGRPGAWQEVQVPRGQQQAVTLPDGSAVTLSAGARLRYREGFRGWFGRSTDRRADLEGTAYFAVVKDGRAFSVQTYNADVRVLGTAFEVQAWPAEESGTAVSVAEGRVALAARSGRDLTLAAGDRAAVAHDADTPSAAALVPVEHVAPWRYGGFVSVNEPLAQVVASLERQFDVVIEIEDVAVSDRRVTLYYPEATLDRVLRDLATMQSLTVERRREGYRLRRP
jgi:ferric-dicitrate binding protein FerR (iron transport regulator)